MNDNKLAVTQKHIESLNKTHNNIPVYPPLRLCSNTHTRTLAVHSRSDVHGGKFLEEKLGGIGKMNLRDLRLVAARATFELVLLQITVSLVSTVRKRTTGNRKGRT